MIVNVAFDSQRSQYSFCWLQSVKGMIGYKSPLMHTALGNYNFIVSINAENAKNFEYHQKNKKPCNYSVTRLFGGDDEDRTHYLYNANVALSQMSYAPTRRMPVL